MELFLSYTEEDPPEQMSYLRPISLCNMVVKCSTKILANRLKPYMTKLTGEEQSSFIPGRGGVDNIVFNSRKCAQYENKTGMMKK